MPKIPPHLYETDDWDKVVEEIEIEEEQERRWRRHNEHRVRPETKPPSPLHRKHKEDS